MSITRYVLKHPVTTIMGLLCLIVFGISSVFSAKLEQMPEMEISIADLGSFLCGMLGAEELPGIEKVGNREELLKKLNRIRVLEGIYINETV